MAAIPYVEATWTATSLGGNFSHYEIDRSENLGAWRRVAEITTEAVNVYRDFEAARPSLEAYRIRVVRADGAASAWSTTRTATTVADADDYFRLVSNEAPQLNLAVLVESDNDQEHTWEFPTNEVEYQIAGRDGAVVLRGLEDPGDRFTLHVVDVDSDGEERAAYDPLLALSRAALSYVAVISPAGRRWFAALTLEQGSQTGARKVYRSPLVVRELTDVPSVIDVASA